MTTTPDTPADPAAPPLDPRAATRRLERTAAAAADSLAHMDAALTAAEAGLAIVRYHHVHRQAHPSAGG